MSTIQQHFTSVESALSSIYGNGVKIVRTSSIAGGDINKAYKLVLTDGNQVFMKSNTKENASFFTAEIAGLNAIAKTKTIGTPRVLGSGTDEVKADCSFLFLEFIDCKGQISNYWETFAHQLADLHQAGTDDFVNDGKYGFACDNYIGAGRQINTACDSWITFFRDYRLKPQFKQAASYFDTADLKKIEKLLGNIENILVEPKHPSLLHGDLWSGNVIAGNDGRAWLIDPAVYVGHAEADIAMTELFGGFPRAFYDAYKESGLLQPEYGRRRDLYNLYHLLNHLNLFGRTYLSSVRRVIEGYAG
ncbi:MAG: fructosamine kinase family protein [Lachnospiraceae bacterium]|nr:fructosamine kinase family protein [Lachnospiraceae bacterium]